MVEWNESLEIFFGPPSYDVFDKKGHFVARFYDLWHAEMFCRYADKKCYNKPLVIK